jgi:hypothetical protein
MAEHLQKLILLITSYIPCFEFSISMSPFFSVLKHVPFDELKCINLNTKHILNIHVYSSESAKGILSSKILDNQDMKFIIWTSLPMLYHTPRF